MVVLWKCKFARREAFDCGTRLTGAYAWLLEEALCDHVAVFAPQPVSCCICRILTGRQSKLGCCPGGRLERNFEHKQIR
ncbi:hypothetical protein AOLI_G00174950 [Acnodon oligacanthus]